MPVFDPQSVPVDSIAGESVLEQTRLNLDWIRTRFADPPEWHPEITDELRLFSVDKTYTNASVLITLVQRAEGLNLLFTRRTAHLTHHAGQISFPGGRVELEDSSLIETALREAHEEIGLSRDYVEILGLLPDYYTGTGYRVTPVVAAVQLPLELQSDANEVAEIFEVPLAYLMDGSRHQLRSSVFPKQEVRRSFYTMPYQDYFIWGATAGMLRNLFHFLRA
nr:CoA pyrophosphatase [Solimicrobium silvestre]